MTSNGFLENPEKRKVHAAPTSCGLFDEEKRNKEKETPRAVPFYDVMLLPQVWSPKVERRGSEKKREILQKHKRRNYLSHLGIFAPPSISP